MKLKSDTSVPKAMEVWNAKVDFDNSTGAKNRPVIVLERKGDSFIVFMVTSHGHHPETDIKLIDPYEVMLDKSSTVRTDRTFVISKDRMNYKMGELCPDDIEMVKMFYSRVKDGKRIRTDYYRFNQEYSLMTLPMLMR